MVTKSKSDWSVLWSIVAIMLAFVSISYCFSHIIEMITSAAERSSRAVSYLTRLIKGGTL